MLVGIHFDNNSRLSSNKNPYPNAVCIADLLIEHGYLTHFYGGARLAYGGKGNFLKAHGFENIYG